MTLVGQEARLLRFPATNGHTILFTYAGDLFSVPITGGEARRLTSHIGYEMFARYSPDGKTIAFTAQYDGNTEVFTMGAQGGEPVRLTYTATLEQDDVANRQGPNNIVMAWTPDGNSIVYRSRQRTDAFVGMLFKVNREGGLSEPLPFPEGGFCSYAPDGSKLAYNRVFREFRAWKYYEGGMADDIWIHDFKTKETINITNHKAQDVIPMWIGDNIYFLSDRDRTMNLFVYNTKSKSTTKVTNFEEYDIKFASHFGKTIVFENGGYIYKVNTDTHNTEKVNISFASENFYARGEEKDVSKMIRSASLAPNGERVLFSARGEVFNLPSKSGATFNMTRTPGANERAAKWSPDGKHIAYISDAGGETEIYLQPQEGGEPIAISSGTTSYIFDFSWSPNGKNIVFYDRENNLKLVDVAAKKTSLVYHDPTGQFNSVEWSPDSKYLTYTRSVDFVNVALNKFYIVYIYDIAAQKEIPVTDRWTHSRYPIFSQDGKYLIFRSARELRPTYSDIESNFVYRYENMDRLYLTILSKDTPSPFLIENDEVGSAGNAGSVGTATNATKEVKIDADGLDRRTFLLPVNPGHEGGTVYSDGDKVYYAAQGGLRVFDLKSKKDELYTDASLMDFSQNGKKALYRKGGAYYVDNFGPKPTLSSPIDLSGMKVTTDYPQEWAQLLGEAWRFTREGFYVPDMHGMDWGAIRKKYEVLLQHARHVKDASFVINEMLAELNCGHISFNLVDFPEPPRIKTGLLGAEISRDPSGFFKIERILKGVNWNPELRSPLTEHGIGAKEGEYIIAIDGIFTNTVNDLYKLLVGKANVNTQLTLNSKPSKEGARKVIIKPLATESQLYHHEWVEGNIRKVNEATDGKIGYIYLPNMGIAGMNEFARLYFSQLHKEGLIIDVRNNGGGNLSHMMLERLGRETYRVTMDRYSDRINTVPNATHIGPKVCLMNKYSCSDGELFPWGFKALGLGPLIGTRTWGGVVGTTTQRVPQFVDGSGLRLPFFTCYSQETGEWIIEGWGVEPDIFVDNDPAKEWAGEDEQLNRAIEEVMKLLPTRKPLLPVPAPKNLSK